MKPGSPAEEPKELTPRTSAALREGRREDAEENGLDYWPRKR
jgi:hypothetical protein